MTQNSKPAQDLTSYELCRTRFVDVLCDYHDLSNGVGERYIDCYTSSNPEDSGVSLAIVDDDGNVRYLKGFVPDPKLHANVIDVIEWCQEIARAKKEELVDKCLEQIQRDVDSGDMTAIAELLKFAPSKSLRDYLPENLS